MNPSGQGHISFARIRKVAIAFQHVSASDSINQDIISSERLLYDLKRNGSEKKMEICLALIEWHRLTRLETNVEAVLALLAEQLKIQSTSNILKKVIEGNFSEKHLFDLIEWFSNYIGRQASSGLENFGTAHQQGRLAFLPAITSPSVILCHLSGLRELPSQYPQVIALDLFIQACIDKNVAGLVDHCLHFKCILSLQTRSRLLQYDLNSRRMEREFERIYSPLTRNNLYPRNDFGKLILSVRRDHILEDSIKLIDSEEQEQVILNGICIQFADEVGEDGGGLIKEWLLVLCQVLVPRTLRLKEEEDGGQRYTVKSRCDLKEAELLGVVLATSLMHDIAVDLPLADYIFRYLIKGEMSVTLGDLEQVQPSVARGLRDMLHCPSADSIDRLSINACYISDDGITVPLVRGGEKTPVTYSNREEFAQSFCHGRLVEERRDTLAAIKDGFDRVWHGTAALQLFTSKEIADFICGKEVECSVDYLRAHTTVECQGSKERFYIEIFWDVLRTADDVEFIGQLILFVTANRRIPLHSSKSIFHILLLQGEEFASRLPTASTCTSTLFLPVYESIDVLRDRLTTALRLGTHGFGLK